MTYTFGKKFTDLQIDAFVNEFYLEFNRDPKQQFFFDLSNTEWISNQELLVFTGILKYLRTGGHNFYVKLFEPGEFEIVGKTGLRNAKNIIELWEVWKIYQILDIGESKNYFGIDDNFIRLLKQRINYKPNLNSEIFQRYGVTPFVSLNLLQEYNDKIVEELVDKELNQYSNLNKALSEILTKLNCTHPFIHKTLSYIVAKEIYENFLEHSSSNFFSTPSSFAFMSSSVIPNRKILEGKEEEIAKSLKLNFETESIPETNEFYFENGHKNQPYIQFTFCDFGAGIPHTLKESFQNQYEKNGSDNEILEFAFTYFGSRQPIYEKLNSIETPIPRGLFDALIIVKRYQGLIVIRSNYGKLLFDFSKNKSIAKAKQTFGNSNLFFPGTLISIYLPAISLNEEFQYSAINSLEKPQIEVLGTVKKRESITFSLYELIKEFENVEKENGLYQLLIEKLKTKISGDNSNKIVFLSFLGWQLNKRISRKVIFFLLSDYEINIQNNVIITYPPEEDFLDAIKYEILALNEVVKKYKIHPLPFAYFDLESKNWDIYWLGIFNLEDQKKLKHILFEGMTYRKDDFNEFSNLEGHIFTYDSLGNLISFMPSEEDLNEYLKGDIIDFESITDFDESPQFIDDYEENELQDFLLNSLEKQTEVKNIIREFVSFAGEDGIFFTSGNYYQKEFIDLSGIFFHKEHLELIVNQLQIELGKLPLEIKEDLLIVGLNSNSHKFIDELDNRISDFSFNILKIPATSIEEVSKDNLSNISNSNVILICDVLATGVKITEFKKLVEASGKQLNMILVVASTLTKEIDFGTKFISLVNNPIKKISYQDIKDNLKNLNIIRINPFTNIPVRFSIQDTLYKESVIFEDSEEFLKYIEEANIEIGLLKFNETLHPYFFNTKRILGSKDEKLLKKIFSIPELNKDIDKINIFYPKDSDIKEVEKNKEWFNANLFNKSNFARFYELERIGTSDGWKFPHTENLIISIEDETAVLFDDGSCTGNSLFQMIDEIAFFNPKEIILICIIGRLKDFHREFFSRQKIIRSKNRISGEDVEIPLKVYFGSIWNIPTYFLQNNPYLSEISWIKKILAINNCPPKIKRIGRKIKTKIEPKEGEKFYNYPYFPKGCDDLKRIIFVRNEIGKVIGYRFYTESFSYFDKIIKQNPFQGDHQSLIDLELICAIISYENDIFEKMALALPDLKFLLVNFIDKVIFTKEIEKFNFEWKIKDFLYLFFLINDKETIFSKFSTNENLIKFFNFFDLDENALDYFHYRILRFVALDYDEILYKNPTKIVSLFERILNGEVVPKKFKSRVKVFRSFISTLPQEGNFEDQLNEICKEYRNISDKQKHDDSISKKYDLIISNLRIYKTSFTGTSKIRILDNWSYLTNFIQKLLSFSKSYSAFFISDLDSLEADREFSLRPIHNYLSEAINGININSDFDLIEKYLITLFTKFIQSDSVFYVLFNNVITRNMDELIFNKFSSFNVKYINRLSINGNFPFYYFEKILDELILNLRHMLQGTEVIITFERLSKNQIKLNFKNEVNQAGESNGENGLHFMDKLNTFPNNLISFNVERLFEGKFFSQTFTFEIN